MVEYTTKEFIKILKRNGYRIARSKGDHDIFRNDISGQHISIPVGKKTLSMPLARRLIKENNLVVED